MQHVQHGRVFLFYNINRICRYTLCLIHLGNFIRITFYC
nr:MAG TPA: hypothetical protein [Caudoviricetes sp.]